MSNDERQQLIKWVKDNLVACNSCAASTPEDEEDEKRQQFYYGMVQAFGMVIKRLETKGQGNNEQ